MSTIIAAKPLEPGSYVQPWLRSARWDLTFIILSAALAVVPYALYTALGGSATESASVRGTASYNARLLVNGLVALLVGGPHMYATFTRSILDPSFFRRHRAFIIASAFVPMVVIGMAAASYESYVWLLTIFFALASLHALQQLVWLTQAYNRQTSFFAGWRGQAIDYAVVLTSLYPIAINRMTRGDFKIGPVELKYTELLAGRLWIVVLASLAFAVALILFVAKTYSESRQGRLNVPKTALISATVLLMFFAPLSPNLDTAFQGINTWHSFQYLVLTWYANRLREERTSERLGFLHGLRLGARQLFGERDGWATFYLVCMAMLPVSGIIYVAARLVWPNIHGGLPGADEAYTYMGVLSILLIHYMHDALLFTDAQTIAPAADRQA